MLPVQDSTPEEKYPLCSSEDKEECLSFDEENVETDYVLAEICSSSEDDEAEDDVI